MLVGVARSPALFRGRRRRSSSTQPSERTLAETLAGINAPPPDATSTRGSTNTRGSTAPPAAVPTIPNVGVATAAAPSSFFAASFGSGGGQQQQGAAAVTPERHSSGSSALDFFSQLSGITSSVLSGTTSSSSSAHPSGATHANDPAAAGMSAFTGNFAGSFPGSQPYASHDGQFGQFVKPEPANPVVQEILQSLPDLSFMLADHLVVPGRDPGGLREFNSRPKVSAASIIASCVPRRAITHAAAALAAGGTGADAGAAAAPAAALVDSSASGTVEIQSTAPASAAATNAAATMEAEESGKQQMPTAGFDSLEDSAGVGHAAITAPAANMASTAPAGVGSATAVSDPGMAPPVAETSVSSVIAGMSMGGFMDDAEEDNDDWGDFES
ncbi:unnamed protein product [Closterium sp. NIES-65]|nr:unnamed protein product [Closterium sp. NIES-65]